MKSRIKHILHWAGASAVVVAVLMAPGCAWGPRVAAVKPTKVERITYHGWENSWRLTSESAEVIVVPDIGRVMSFRLLTGENVFWEDRSLAGKRGDASGKEWTNFGGDKTWPAPEAEWSKYTGRKQWMPPLVFDALPAIATVTNNEVVLTSAIDPHYGIRTIRRIRLSWNQLFITTTYERISGEPLKVGIWVITQLKEPAMIFVPVKSDSIFVDGHFKFSSEPWPQLQVKSNRIEITRDTKVPHKMGSDARRLLWVGEKDVCTVATAPTVGAGAEYPDRGASAEVYTNPNPKKYIELELLGPLSIMKPGDQISLASTYTLSKRKQKTPEAEFSAHGW